MHNLDHSATATFIQPDGSRVTLGKTFHEVYKKKRGSMTAEYTGNTVDYYIDGVPTKEKDYTAAVAAYCGGAEMMKLLTMPDYFPRIMEWKKRRELLLEICGDVTDETVIESSKDLADLPMYLLKPGTLGQYYTVEEYSKIAKARKTDINKQLEGIPLRIDEAQRGAAANLPARAKVEAEIAAASALSAKCRQDAGNIQAAGAEGIQSALAAAQAKLSTAKADYTRRNAEDTAGAYEELARMDKAIREAERRAEDLRAEASVKRRQADRTTSLRESILQEYRDAQAVKWDESRETCPTCGRRLEEHDIEAMRSDFNMKRSEHLAAINARGKKEANKDMIAELRQQADDMEQQAAAAEAEAGDMKAKRQAVADGIAVAPDFETTAEYKTITAEIVQLQQQAADAQRSVEAAQRAADQKTQAALAREHELRGVLFQIEEAEKRQARIAELEAEEKRLAEEYESVERGVYLCELFTKTKVSLLTERINSKFRSVSFQLFIEQVNGGVSECCEVMVPCDGAMVPYADANHAAKVNAGLEIVATIAEHYGQEMPVFVDNAESITKLADTGGQVIRLVVSEADKELRVVEAA